jgi:hypothetical protein
MELLFPHVVRRERSPKAVVNNISPKSINYRIPDTTTTSKTVKFGGKTVKFGGKTVIWES